VTAIQKRLSRRYFLRTLAGTAGLVGANASWPRLAEAASIYPFEEVPASASHITWVHTAGKSPQKYLPETTGAGCAFLDYDNDGWMDIYLVNSGKCDFYNPDPPLRNALYRNNRDGTFTDVTEKAGVAAGGYGQGVAVGDYDGDGLPDLYVTQYGKCILYHNNGDGTFSDVTERAGVAAAGWASSAVWFDYDNDGRLDLFVCNFVDFNKTKNLNCVASNKPGYCVPTLYKPAASWLFHNNGDGTFTDMSKRAGVSDEKPYYGLASLFIDINGDGKVDLLVADDSTPNYLYINKGDGTFDDESFASGYALNESGRETASMGIATGDYLHNGLIDIYHTTFSDDYNPLYRNDGDANFTEISYQAGIAEATIPFLGWGTAFFDYDNDGWLDLFMVNGHVYPSVDQQNWGTTWAQRPLLFHNVQGKLRLVPPVEGTGLAKVAVARGMAYGDLFNDGKIDVVINNMDSSPSLFQNVTETSNHWIAFKLIGGPKSPRDAIGSTVYVTANGFRQRADVISGGSYASSSDPRLHFGIGGATKIDQVEIHWSDGVVEKFILPSIDAIFTVTEGKGALVPKPASH